MSLGVALRWPLYLSFRWFGWPRMNPISLTVSLSNRCNHRCRTCFVYEHLQDDLTIEEYRQIFSSLGRGVRYLTLSGGEPFLRADLVDICRLVRQYLDPDVLLIPTNGLLDDRIPGQVEQILEIFEGRQVVINLSLDAVGERHDEIRGRKGAYERAMGTYRGLQAIEASHLTRGIHTVISRFNIDEIESIDRALAELEPDSLISEVAEQREELFTTEVEITPPVEKLAAAVEGMQRRDAPAHPWGSPARLIGAFRRLYQRNAVRILRRQRQFPPCQAGFMSAHISPAGEVWACCTEARSFGNLRELEYDWRRVWFESPRREPIRDRIRRGECACPLANVGYLNILFHPPSLARAAWGYLRG